MKLSSFHESRRRAFQLPMISTQRRTHGLLILIVLCWATMTPVTSATFWSSASYVAGEDFSLARRQRRAAAQQLQPQQPLSTQSEQRSKENEKETVKPLEESVVPSATPRMIDTFTHKAAEEASCAGGDDAPVATAATFTTQEVQLATNKAATTTTTTTTPRKVAANSLSEPTTLDTVPVPVAPSKMAISSDSSNASDSSPISSILLPQKEKQQQQQQQQQQEAQQQQPKVSPAGVTRYILVSAVLALSLLNIHLYISL